MKIFASVYENALRLLLTLEAADSPLTGGLVFLTDYIATYGNTFGLTKENPQGENPLKFVEFKARCQGGAEALTRLAETGLVRMDYGPGGFQYALTEKGRDAAARVTGSYADAYREAARLALRYARKKPRGLSPLGKERFFIPGTPSARFPRSPLKKLRPLKTLVGRRSAARAVPEPRPHALPLPKPEYKREEILLRIVLIKSRL